MGIQGMSEVPEIWHIPQCKTRGTSEVPQRHNSLLRELLMPPPIIGQGNVDFMSSTSSSDSITRMVQVVLEENRDTDPEKSALSRAGIKIPHPVTYSGSADLEDLEIFITGVLRVVIYLCCDLPTPLYSHTYHLPEPYNKSSTARHDPAT